MRSVSHAQYQHLRAHRPLRLACFYTGLTSVFCVKLDSVRDSLLMQGNSEFSVERVTRTRPRRFAGGAPRETCAKEEMQEQCEMYENHEPLRKRNPCSWRDAVDTILGTSPRKVWRTLNGCLPALLLVTTIFTYFAWKDKLVRLMLLGFIALTLVFWALLNWVLMQVLPPEKGD